MTYAEQAIDFLETGGDIQDVDFPDTHSIMESGRINDCELIIFEDKSSIISASEGWEVNPEVVSISDYDYNFTVNGFSFLITENGAEPFFSCQGFIFPMINTSLNDEEIQKELERIVQNLIWDGQTYVLT